MVMGTAGKIALWCAYFSFIPKMYANLIGDEVNVSPTISCRVLDEARRPAGLPCSDFVSDQSSVVVRNWIESGGFDVTAVAFDWGNILVRPLHYPVETPGFIDYSIFASSSYSQLLAVYGVNEPVYLNISAWYDIDCCGLPTRAYAGLCSGQEAVSWNARILMSPGETFRVCADGFAGGEQVFGLLGLDYGGGSGMSTRFWITTLDGGFAEGAYFQPIPEPGTTILVGLPLALAALRRLTKNRIA
jgi:hypothetical protein